MSTAVIILIALGVLVILAAIYMASRRQVTQRREDERLIASEHREEAERNRLDAAKESAIAEEEAARAKRQAAEAEQRAQSAQLAENRADAHEEQARELDPDLDNRELDDRDEASDGEREGLYTGEHPPERSSETEPARHNA
jgi:hypothetical protein